MNENKMGAGEPLGPDAYMDSYEDYTTDDKKVESTTENSPDSAIGEEVTDIEKQEGGNKDSAENEDRFAPGRSRREAIMNSGNQLKKGASKWLNKAGKGISSFFGKAKAMGVKTIDATLSTPELYQEAKEKTAEKIDQTGEALDAWSDRTSEKFQGAVVNIITVVEEHLKSAGKEVMETKEDIASYINKQLKESEDALLNKASAMYDGYYDMKGSIGGKVEALAQAGKKKNEEIRQVVSNIATVAKIMGAMAIEPGREVLEGASQAIAQKYEQVNNFASAHSERFSMNVRSTRNKWLNKLNAFRMNRYQEKANKNQEKADAIASKMEALSLLQNVTPEKAIDLNRSEQGNEEPLAAAA